MPKCYGICTWLSFRSWAYGASDPLMERSLRFTANTGVYFPLRTCVLVGFQLMEHSHSTICIPGEMCNGADQSALLTSCKY